ncbi:MAG: hypothetical protein E7381_01560 [Clostridiales bacterium]|nr:hypothetical protein [Clostridiales bacterium]
MRKFPNRKTENTVRYFLLLVFVLFFFFLSNDFGLIDIQKTAIVMAVGVDREEDTFIVTSQIAVPQSSKQGKSTQTVQIVSRGNTVAQAFEEINAKTGWYPKLVFCRLIILGEKTAEKNVFDALDFFLLDEYLSDNCLLATCDGTAKDLLNVTALIDPSGSLAMQKVLSPHAERVGATLPSTLREFSIGYFSDGRSAYLPVLKTQPQQEQIGSSNGGGATQSGQSESQNGGQTGEQTQDKPVFSAGDTALFLAGKRVGTLTKEETFAFNAVKSKLRLATYSVAEKDGTYTLNVKRNSPKVQFTLGADGRASYKIQVTLSAGLLDYSNALSLDEGTDAGDVPETVFANAEKRLSGQIKTAFEKCRAVNCDIFGLTEELQKKEKDSYQTLRQSVLETAILEVSVTFRNIR